MGIVWLASYPKSGNTWLRFMLYAYLHGQIDASIDVARRIPDLHRAVPGQLPALPQQLIKTHFRLTDAHPMLEQTERAIHIVRNPRDVALSALNYRKLTGEGAKAFTEKGYLKGFIRTGGDADWLRLGFGTWSQHARSWRKTARFPVLSLRYEDLKEKPAKGLRSMVEFLGQTPDEERIQRAVRESSFDAMRAMEIREKAKPTKDAHHKRLFVGDSNAARKGVYFVNKGASNQSLAAYSPKLDEQFTTAFGECMRELGYEP